MLTAEDGGAAGFAALRAGGRSRLTRTGCRQPVPGRGRAMAYDPNLRASDADRDRTASLLREHLAAGRLTADEFNERLDRAFAARTVGEIDALLKDLPRIDLYRLPDAALTRTPRQQQPPRRGPRGHSGAWRAAWGVVVHRRLICFVVWGLSGGRLPVAAVGGRSLGSGPGRQLGDVDRAQGRDRPRFPAGWPWPGAAAPRRRGPARPPRAAQPAAAGASAGIGKAPRLFYSVDHRLTGLVRVASGPEVDFPTAHELLSACGGSSAHCDLSQPGRPHP